ncbi:integrin alpha-X-like [Alosa pseudoharengus]|uniref:integrin alpha-X-like n=1 Tax=Alosa pseudoharengus TaxID=34774 RepID=UPI003F8C8A3A
MNRHTLIVGLLQVASVTWGFNLEKTNPRIFYQKPGSYFGYQVCHFGPKGSNSILVTSPLHQNGTGGVYKCPYTGQCELLPMKVNPGISLGMSLACTADRAMVCGPRLTEECNHLTHLNGLCVEISQRFTESKSIKPAFQECRDISLDAVVLYDSSQSISDLEFRTMIEFIKAIIRMFTDPGTQVAVAQYATDNHAVFNFENFAAKRKENPVDLMNEVRHEKGNTYTAAAIRFVLENMFTEDKGMQKDSKKLLIVITDGKSNDKTETLDAVLPLAQDMNVTMYAIGVGKQFSYDELLKISLNNSKNVMMTESFDALNSIQNELKSKIFAIEGTGAVSNHSSFEKELSQGGFSIALSEDESTFGAVGAYTWSGGLEKYGLRLDATFINASAEEKDLRDSYLGYSVALLSVNRRAVYFAGAPRYRHTGLVLGFQQSHNDTWTITYRIPGSQFGSYFGSALCTLTGKSYGTNGLLVIGAPSHHGKGVGGEVHICQMEYETPNCSQRLRGTPGNERGQFGSSLSSCPDLNGDRAPELAVGAPSENNGKGSLYIFLSDSRGIRSEYSQRIAGSQLNSRLQYFGLSVHSAGDLSSDGLTDLVVGGKGSATIIRSHPVMCLRVSVTLDPPIIPQDSFHCSDPRGLDRPVSTVHVCVTLQEVVKGTIQIPFKTAVSASLELDEQIKPLRLVLSSNRQWNMNLTGSQTFCQNLTLNLPACISDYHDQDLLGTLVADVEDIPGSNGLRPMLSPDCPLEFLSKVLLEKVCGEDHVCVPDLHVSVKFTSPVVVNISGFQVEVLVDVLNNGEDASAIKMELLFPSSLSLTKVRQTVDKSPVLYGLNSTGKGLYSFMASDLGPTVIRQGARTAIQISLMVFNQTSLSDILSVNVSVMSKNEDVLKLQDNSAQATVPVKLPFDVIIQEGESTTRYIRFPDKTELKHEFKVENIGELAVPVNVTFVLPVQMEFGFSWSVGLSGREGQKEKCFKERPVTEEENKDCKSDICHLIVCAISSLSVKKPISFIFSGVISRNTRGSGVQVKAESWAFLSLDETHYTHFPGSGGLSRSIVSELEVPSQGPATVIATVSVFCTLIVLLIIFGILYKLGFFKSRETLYGSSPSEDAAPEGDGTTPPGDQSADTAEAKVDGDGTS